MPKLDLSGYEWFNQPVCYELTNQHILIFTEPRTDLWQRTHYGFSHDNAHAFLCFPRRTEFTFSFSVTWQPKSQYDQCGLLYYQDADNWFKASVEYEDAHFSRLGSVVTNLGYSDWATTNISSEKRRMTYRMSRRGSDFLLEHAADGAGFEQMRIFHMHRAVDKARVGIYACSPLESSFQARFENLCLTDCQWQLYSEH